MWVTADGVAHTVALPEPRQVLSPRALESLTVLMTTAAEDLLLATIERAQDAVLEGPLHPDEDDGGVGCAPSPEVLDADVSTLDAVLAAIRDVDLRWRLDVVMALDDIVGELPDD